MVKYKVQLYIHAENMGTVLKKLSNIGCQIMSIKQSQNVSTNNEKEN